MTININYNNLPRGSYDYILIQCIDKANEKDNKGIENKCVYDSSKYMVKCICNNLIGGTEYKIKLITRKQNWTDAILENIANQYTGM